MSIDCAKVEQPTGKPLEPLLDDRLVAVKAKVNLTPAQWERALRPRRRFDRRARRTTQAPVAKQKP
jgi:hypothetical protein